MPLLKVKLKDDYVIPSGKEFKVYSGIGATDRQTAQSGPEANGQQATIQFDMEYVKARPELFEVLEVTSDEW